MITHIVRDFGTHESCFAIESTSPLNAVEHEMLRWAIAESYEPQLTYNRQVDARRNVIEIGPAARMETPDSSNAVGICQSWGLKKVTRIEESRIYKTDNGISREEIMAKYLDRMTQEVYPDGGIMSFDTHIITPDVQIIDVLRIGRTAICEANKMLGLGMDEWDINYYTSLFMDDLMRNPTDVECKQIGTCNSEHCRHGYYKGIQVIDGVKMPQTLLEMVMSPLRAIRARGDRDVTVLAFNDNVGALRGHMTRVFRPINPGQASFFKIVRRIFNIVASAETHNYPVLYCPYPGAATKIGGWIRDMFAGGQGSYVKHALAGYCFSNLFMPDYEIAGEVVGREPSNNYANPWRILTEGLRGDYDYGNQFGVPTTGGICRSFRQIVSGEDIGFVKPVCYGGGAGLQEASHTKKRKPAVGDLIVIIGGPVYPVGKGGGSASSFVLTSEDAKLALDAVQRGNAEMENKATRVIHTCIAMGPKNIIESIHDSGAGGNSNVITELTGKLGGKVDIRKFALGDKSMSVIDVWTSEPQERFGIEIKAKNLGKLQAICKRERVGCEVLGEITGDGHITVIDSQNNTTPVRLPLDKILENLPQKTFNHIRIPKVLKPANIPTGLTLKRALEIVFQQLSTGSNSYLTDTVDRSVGGCVVGSGQQCVGRNQLPIGNVQVSVNDFFDLYGCATALGENPLYMLINPKAGGRIALGELLTNMISAGGINLEDIRFRLNVMWPAKLPGEGALLYDAVEATVEAMIEFMNACCGGKDSLAMAADENGKTVKSPGQMIILGYAAMPDVTKVWTPDIKEPGKTHLSLIDLGFGKNRMGGSALLQALNQLGDESPDCDADPVSATWRAMNALYKRGAILSIHDRSDGGLATSIVEMCLGGNAGLQHRDNSNLPFLFNQELGLIIEHYPDEAKMINKVLSQEGAPELLNLGATTGGKYANVFASIFPLSAKCGNVQASKSKSTC